MSTYFSTGHIYNIRPNKKAAQGIVLSSLALGDIEGAITFSQQFGDNSLYLSALDKQLSLQTIPSSAAYHTAEKILQVEPKHVNATSAIAWYLHQQQKYSEALEMFKKWHELEPENEDAIVGQVLCLQELKNEEGLLLLVNKFPNQQSRIYAGLALSNFEQNKLDVANDYYRKLSNIQALDKDQMSAYACSLNKNKQYQQSSELFSKLLTDFNDSDALTGLIVNYQAVNDSDALKALRKQYQDRDEYKSVFVEFGLADDKWLSFALNTAVEEKKQQTAFCILTNHLYGIALKILIKVEMI